MNLVTPSQSWSFSFKVKQSRFISYLRQCETGSDFKSWLSQLRKDHYDASHICWAYRIQEGSQLEHHSSDAGEPSGTAGQPILKAMKQNNLVQCGLAVARYFGGTKLGKRGLINAYGTAARNVIDQTTLIEWVRKERYLITCPIQYYGDLSQALLQTGEKILEDQSSNDLKWIVEIKTGMISDLIKIVRIVTKGEGDLDRV